MNRFFIYVVGVLCLISCGQAGDTKNKSGTSQVGIGDMQEGKDYVILKRFRVVDN